MELTNIKTDALFSFFNKFISLGWGGGGKLSPLGTSATIRTVAPVPGNENWQGKQEYSKKSCPSATNSTWPGLEPGPQLWESYGTHIMASLTRMSAAEPDWGSAYQYLIAIEWQAHVWPQGRSPSCIWIVTTAPLPQSLLHTAACKWADCQTVITSLHRNTLYQINLDCPIDGQNPKCSTAKTMNQFHSSNITTTHLLKININKYYPPICAFTSVCPLYWGSSVIIFTNSLLPIF
jgi:hypothetical protein